MMRIGIVCSTGGGAVLQAYSLLKELGDSPQFFVVTDRVCGIEKHCDRLGIQRVRVEQPDRQLFSAEAAKWLYEVHKVDWVCLFFSRLVSSELFSRGNCLNIHPSLLPAYPGMGALAKAWKDRVLFHGATAHLADFTMDEGPIIAQVSAPLSRAQSKQQAERVSFAQKVYLFLVLWEIANSRDSTWVLHLSDQRTPVHAWANPGLKNPSLAKIFDVFLIEENIPWIR